MCYTTLTLTICYKDFKNIYMYELGFMIMKNIFVLEPGKELDNGLYLVHDDDLIRELYIILINILGLETWNSILIMK